MITEKYSKVSMNVIIVYGTEDNHDIKIQYHLRQRRIRYPRKQIMTTYRKHMYMYYPFSSIAQYNLFFRRKSKGKKHKPLFFYRMWITILESEKMNIRKKFIFSLK